jgi:hypothetical protein
MRECREYPDPVAGIPGTHKMTGGSLEGSAVRAAGDRWQPSFLPPSSSAFRR